MNQLSPHQRLTILGLTLPLALYASGCVEVAPPDDAVISCTGPDSEECPDGWTCKQNAEGEYQCVQSSGTNADVDPPELSGTPLITPALGTDGTLFTVCFSASESLSSDPVVNLNAGAGLIALDAAESKPEACTDHTYAYQWTASADKAAAGTHPLTVTLFDEALNIADGLSLGTLTLDFAAPVLSGGIRLEPSPAKLGDTVQLSFSLSEAADDNIVVSMSQNEETRTWVTSAENIEGYEFTFEHEVSSVDTDGAWSVFVTATDLAGNDSGPLVATELVIDQDPGALVVEVQDVETTLGPGNVLVVKAISAEAIASDETMQMVASPSAGHTGSWSPTFSSAQGAGTERVFQSVISPVDCDGLQTTYDITVSGGTDEAGNTFPSTTLSDAFTIDCAAPQLTSCIYPAGPEPSICPDPDSLQFKEGDEMVIRLLADEQAITTVYLNSSPLSTCTPNGLETICTRIIGSQEEGSWTITASITDDYGNNQIANLGSVLYDGIKPTVNVVADPGPHGLGTTIFLTIAASEPVALDDLRSGATPLFSQVTLEEALVNDASSQISWQWTISDATTSGTYENVLVFEDDFGNLSDNVSIGPIVIDSTRPNVGEVSTNAGTYSAEDGFNEVRASFSVEDLFCAELETADAGIADCTGHLAVSADFKGEPMDCSPVEDSADFECQRILTSPSTDGPANIQISVSDSAGNIENAAKTVQLDFTPPTITSAEIRHRPGPNNVLYSVDALTISDSRADLVFTTNETASLESDQENRHIWTNCDQETLVFTLPESEPTLSFSAYVRIENDDFPPMELACPIELAGLIDETGNSTGPLSFAEATHLASVEVHVDTIPTPTPEAIEESEVKLLRVPWGAEQTDGAPGNFLVSRALEGNEAPLSRLISGDLIVDGDDVATLLIFGPNDQIVGTLVNEGVGVIQPLQLTIGDAAFVTLAAVDSAGNVSTERQLVSTVEWVATMGDKVSGSLFENPHRFESRHQFHHTITQGNSPEFGESNGLSATPNGNTVSTKGASTWQKLGSNWPGNTKGNVAWDAHRQEAISFGGVVLNSGQNTNTWRFDGRTWRLVHVQDVDGDGDPPGRNYPALAFDHRRGLMVLAGGFLYNTSDGFREVWEWNGTDWKETSVAEGNAVPDQRTHHTMAYDYTNGFVLLFGGMNTSLDQSLNDTWYWTGDNWIRCHVSSTICPVTDSEGDGDPAARSGHSMAYDHNLKEVLLYGGILEDGTPTNDLWSWNGNRWKRQDDGSGVAPPPRDGAAMAFDQTDARMVLYGGKLASGDFDDSLWSYDGQWEKVTLTDAHGDGNPGTLYQANLLYNPDKQQTLLTSGIVEIVFLTEEINKQTWELSGNNFRLIHKGKAPHSLEKSRPPARRFTASWYNPATDEVNLFGGESTNGLTNERWSWNGSEWFNNGFASIETPAERYWGHQAVYDAHEEEVVLYGGFPNYIGFFDDPLTDTWTLGSDGQWQEEAPATSPSASFATAMVYDERRNTTVLFTENGLWQWDGIDWNLLPDSGLTGAMIQAYFLPTAVYDTKRGFSWAQCLDNFIGFNGTTVEEYPFIPIDSPPQTDGGTPDHAGTLYGDIQNSAMAYDSQTASTILYSGLSPNGTINNTVVWEWDGHQWAERPTRGSPQDGTPPSRRDAALIFDPTRDELNLFGGISTDVMLDDHWILNRNDDGRPGQAFIVAFAAAGGPNPGACLSPFEECGIEDVSIRAVAGARHSVHNSFRLVTEDLSSGAVPDLVTVFPDETAPEDSLEPLLGLQGDTKWTLELEDFYSLDDGVLNTWCLILNGGAERCASPNMPLRYLSKMDHSIWVTDAQEVTDIAVRVDITHAYAKDLRIDLVVSEPVLGAELGVFRNGYFEPVDTNAADAHSPAELRADFSSDDTIGALFTGPEQSLAVGFLPTGANGLGGPWAEVTTDYVEARITYRVPQSALSETNQVP